MARSYDNDGEAFYADPEKYKFTREEIQALNESDLREFEQRTPMTGPEKRALRKWVASGHSWRESPGSKYICDIGMDFLQVYRADHEIAAAVRGMTSEQKAAYIKEYTGYVDPTPEERERMEAVNNTPAYVSRRYEKMARQLFVLWDYLAEEGLYAEAKEYLEEHMDEDIPLPFSFILD